MKLLVLVFWAIKTFRFGYETFRANSLLYFRAFESQSDTFSQFSQGSIAVLFSRRYTFVGGLRRPYLKKFRHIFKTCRHFFVSFLDISEESSPVVE